MIGYFANSTNWKQLKLPAVELRGIFSVEYDFILKSLANPVATLYATIKDKATRNALAKHFQNKINKLWEIDSSCSWGLGSTLRLYFTQLEIAGKSQIITGHPSFPSRKGERNKSTSQNLLEDITRKRVDKFQERA